jgi:hypothetical protein
MGHPPKSDSRDVAAARPEDTKDPYGFHPDDVEAPPRSIGAILRRIGPGMILAASIVGSGELIATTTLGAEVGYVALWIILLSCVAKPALQAEIGRYTISTGKTDLQAFEYGGLSPKMVGSPSARYFRCGGRVSRRVNFGATIHLYPLAAAGRLSYNKRRSVLFATKHDGVLVGGLTPDGREVPRSLSDSGKARRRRHGSRLQGP